MTIFQFTYSFFFLSQEYQARVSAGLADIRRKVSPLPKVLAPNISTTELSSQKVPASTVVIVEEVPVEKKNALQGVPVDEDFIAEVLAEEVTLQTKSERSTAARIKGPRKVTLVSLNRHNLSSKEDNEATVRNGNGQQEEVPVAVEMPLVKADMRTPTAGAEDVRLNSKLSSQSYEDPFVLEKVQRIQQLRKGRLEVELKRKEAADRAR